MGSNGSGGGSSNGSGNGRLARRVRVDPLAGAESTAGPGVSGRRFVVVACLAILAIWAVAYLALQSWRDRYRERAAYGATRVAPAVDPLAELSPPGVDPAAWRSAVADTHTMLVALTASGLLDADQMRDLRGDLAGRVESASPASALAVLTAIWDDMERKAGPVIAPSGPPPPGSRHAARVPRPARPAILGPPAGPTAG